jgi:hypothetical protein
MRRIFCFWFGDSMSANRSRCFDSIIENSQIPVILITESNLNQYIKDEMHPGFDFLSATHKSDYLRSYFMYNYGGGYSDIKFCDHSWIPYFKKLENSEKFFNSFPEQSSKTVAYKPAKDYYYKLGGTSQYIFKKNTPFAKRWLDETNAKMDEIYLELVQNPGTYHPRAIKGGVHGEPGIFLDSKYPLEWNELLGRILHRIQLDYFDQFLLDMPFPNIKDYR